MRLSWGFTSARRAACQPYHSSSNQVGWQAVITAVSLVSHLVEEAVQGCLVPVSAAQHGKEAQQQLPACAPQQVLSSSTSAIQGSRGSTRDESKAEEVVTLEHSTRQAGYVHTQHVAESIPDNTGKHTTPALRLGLSDTANTGKSPSDASNRRAHVVQASGAAAAAAPVSLFLGVWCISAPDFKEVCIVRELAK